LIVLMLTAVGLGVALHYRMDYQEVVEASLAARGQELPPEQVEQAIEIRERFGVLFAGFGAVFGALFYLLTAFLFWMALHLQGSEITYKASFSTYLHGALPLGLLALLSAGVVLAGNGVGFAEVTSGTFLASNLAFLAPEGTSIPVRAFLGAIDFFALWAVALWSIGYRVTGRVSATAATVTSVVIWLLGVGLRVGFAALGSGGGS
jgi:hypothetical protein